MMFRLGQTILITSAGAAALLFVTWSRPVLAVGVVIIAVLGWMIAEAGDRPTAGGVLAVALPGVVQAMVSVRPWLWDWNEWLIWRRDYFFIWGYKARLFYVERGVVLRFLATWPDDFGHMDYPLLVPLQFDVVAVLGGRFEPRMFGPFQTLLGIALLAIAHQCLRDEFTPREAALGTLALSSAALVPWFGFGEPTLVAYAASGALLVRRVLRGHSRSIGPAVFFLACAAMTKNEGMAFFVAVCIAAPRIARRLWPAAAVITAWLIMRGVLGLHTDVFAGHFFARFMHNVPLIPRGLAFMPTYGSLTVAVSMIAIARNPVVHATRERFLLVLASIQILFYLAIYAGTPSDVVSHVNGSWDRISSHVTMLIGFAGLMSLRRPVSPEPT
jgi:hypothetical protein